MARPILPFLDFSKGLNIETSNENLQNNECMVLQNADLSTRGSVKRRSGRTKLGSISGKGQGMFFYYRGQETPDIIVAVSGRLYHLNNGVPQEIPITDSGSPFTFQATLPIEAVQYRDELFIATGTKLIELKYDAGWVAKTVTPYKPTVLEVINIGTNAIANDPSTWIQEKEASELSVEGITPSLPQAPVNTAVRFTAHIMKPPNIDVDCAISYRRTAAGYYTAVPTTGNYADISFNEIGSYDIKVDVSSRVHVVNDANTLWTGSQPGIKIQLSTNPADSANSSLAPALVLTRQTGDFDNTQPQVWYDFPDPLDMTKGNRVKWRFMVYQYQVLPESGHLGTAHKLLFYTEGNLTTPALTINANDGWKTTRNNGWIYNYPESTYDNTLTGLDKIVRVAFLSESEPGMEYTPGTVEFGEFIDRSTRLDQIEMYYALTPASYTKTDYQVGGVVDPTIDPETYSAIHTSRSVRLHHDRLILSRDNKYPGQIYISDLNNPRYFPTNKRLDFSLDRKEGITAITRFKDYLVIFTKTTISVLTGKGPQDGEIVVGDTYSIKMIHDRIGCIAERSAQVVGNEIFFLGDDGLYTLRPNDYQLNDLNVQRIDHNVKSLVTRDEEACAMVFDNQYWICFPSKKEILRMYYQTGAWVQDTSNKLNISQFLLYTDDAYNLTDDGVIYHHDPNVYADDGDIYQLVIESKYIDLQSSFNRKKLRRLFVLANYYDGHTVPLYVRVYADAQIVLNPTIGEASVNEAGYVEWTSNTEPNMHFYSSTTFGGWVMGQSLLGQANLFINEAKIRGKCRRVKVSFVHNQNHEAEIYGFGVEFKYKKA